MAAGDASRRIGLKAVEEAPHVQLLPALDAVFQRLADIEIVVAGDLVLDAYVEGETGRISREAPVIIVRKTAQHYRLGGAANTAANFAALGAKVHMLGPLGDDLAGERLRGALEAAGVHTDMLVASGSETPVKTRILAGALGTGKQQILRIDEEPQSALSDDCHARMAQRLRDWQGATVISDYDLGALSPQNIALLAEIKASGRFVAVDSRRRLLDFKGVSLIKPNLPEAERLVGFGIQDHRDVARASARLLEDSGADACLLTQGRGGMSLCRRGQARIHTPIIGEEEVVDVSGAGDTTLAAFCAAKVADLDDRSASLLSACAATVVVKKMGTAVAEPHEIAALAAQHRLDF